MIRENAGSGNRQVQYVIQIDRIGGGRIWSGCSVLLSVLLQELHSSLCLRLTLVRLSERESNSKRKSGRFCTDHALQNAMDKVFHGIPFFLSWGAAD